MALICIFLMTSDVEHVFICFLAIWIASLEKCPFRSIALFFFFFLFKIVWFLWVFVAMCRLSLVVVSRGHSLVVVCGLLIQVASLVAEHQFWGARASVIVHRGSVVVARA